MTPVGVLAVTGLWGATVLLLAIVLGGCSSAPAPQDPYLHSEEPALAAFCASHPHRGTCP